MTAKSLTILKLSVKISFQFMVNYVTAVVHSLSYLQLFAAPWAAAHQASQSFTVFVL